jgi:hypothetical protein
VRGPPDTGVSGSRNLAVAKVGLALLGMFIWGYGVQADDSRVRWVGIALLAAAFLLRFFMPRRPRD